MDQQLQICLSQIARDDQQAFNALMMQFGNTLQRFAYNLVGNMQEAEEVVYDVFIKIWQKRKSLPPAASLKYYLFKAVKNTSLNYIKRNDRLEGCYADWQVEVSSHVNYTPEDIIISKEYICLIQKAIGALPPRCRQIFVLVKEEGLSYAEVAELLEISVATVNVQMTIAAKKVWNVLDPVLRISQS